MNTKTLIIMISIIWFCIGGTVTLGITKMFWNTKILPDMYQALDDCYKQKLDLLK